MYSCPVSVLGETGRRRSVKRIFLLEMLDRPVSENDQKKDGDQPDPGKKKPAEPETERDGDKGSQRVKRPKKRIGTPPPPKERGISGLLIALRSFC